jgi:hypothetical protein
MRRGVPSSTVQFCVDSSSRERALLAKEAASEKKSFFQFFINAELIGD